MIYCIPKGWHYSLPKWPRLALKENYTWFVKFNNSCKYDIGIEQMDWNKLIGVSNTLNPREDSVRFVWRYVHPIDMFEIGVYVEKNKKWTVEHIAFIKKCARLNMNFYKTLVEVFVNDKMKIVDFGKKRISFISNPYFGGNIPAPHSMTLKINNL